MRDVVVLGAGVIGLTSAVRLAEAGARVTVLAAAEPARTVSRVAAAVWYPTRTSADVRVLDWAGRTFDTLAAQARSGVPGVVMRPTRMLLRESVTGNPWWASAVPDFREVDPPDGYAGQWRFTVPTVEMGPYLDWLVARLAGLDVPVRRHRVDRIEDAVGVVAAGARSPASRMPPLLVNATGLAAGTLADDPDVHPIRGRIVLVANPGLITSVRDEGNPAGITYVHPRSRDVVLGGTFEPYRTETGPDETAGRAILSRCAALVPELAGAPVLGQLAGLRPGRHGGPRVAGDPSDRAGPAQLIHNYGHGGAGVTLAWGCADEVVALADTGSV